MHITPEELNLMFQGKANPDQQAAWTDHILECPTCTARFKALHALHRELEPAPARIPLRYLLGVAAVMAMCILPYLDRPTSTQVAVAQTHPTRVEVAEVAMVEQAASQPTDELALAAPQAQSRARTAHRHRSRSVEASRPTVVETAQLSVLDRVAEVNFSQSLAKWGQDASLIDLIELKNGSR